MLVLLASLALASDPPLCVAVTLETGGEELGHIGLWQLEDGPRQPVAAHETPAGYVAIGPFSDTEGIPFRTWSELKFKRPFLRMLNASVGVGFTVQAWLRPDLNYEIVGANGTMGFEGVLELSSGKHLLESIPITWGRGFEKRPDGADHHEHSVAHQTQIATAGKKWPYTWTLTGVLSSDVHVWSGP